MDLLAAIKREERKLEKELGKLQHQLNGVRAAARALGAKTVREVTEVSVPNSAAPSIAVDRHFDGHLGSAPHISRVEWQREIGTGVIP